MWESDLKFVITGKIHEAPEHSELRIQVRRGGQRTCVTLSGIFFTMGQMPETTWNDKSVKGTHIYIHVFSSKRCVWKTFHSQTVRNTVDRFKDSRSDGSFTREGVTV